jgi:nicotinate-nucleotide adenylyltransferase
MAKSFSEEALKGLARLDGEPLSRLEKKKPSLLHARAAAVLLRDRFGIEDADILEAVRYHTMGRPGMGPLARVVYIADKIEISRGGIKAELREFTGYADLDSLFTAVLDETVAFLRSQKMDLSAGTLRLLEAMHTRRPL